MRPARKAGERILGAAAELFSSQGFRGTSTRDIAHRARVSEVTIFRLFRTKQELFLRVLESTVETRAPEWLAEALHAAAEPGQVVREVAARLDGMFTPTFMRLIFFAGLEQPQTLARFLQPRLTGFYQTLGEYLERRMRSGAMRQSDPMLAARALVGLVFYERIFMELLGGRQLLVRSNAANPLEVYADIWLRGMLPDREDAVSADEDAVLAAGGET